MLLAVSITSFGLPTVASASPDPDELSAKEDMAAVEEDEVPSGTKKTLPQQAPTSPSKDSSATGELFSNGRSLVATEFGGVRITVSAEGATSSPRFLLEGNALAAMRKAIGSDTAKVMRINDVGEGADYLASSDETGLSVLVEIASHESDHQHRFDIGLPEGGMLIPSEDGSIDVLGNDRYSIGTFEKPWALDANGNRIPTHYMVDGNSIIQVINADKSAAYPIIADPKFTWGIVTGTVYFNKQETGWLCALGRTALGWMVITGFWYPIIVAALLATSVSMCIAVLMDKCVKIKSTFAVRYYTGGYCT